MIKIDIFKKIRVFEGSSGIRVRTEFHTEGITQITGPSGSGKTTLLKIIAGLIHPEKGKISFGDEVWLDISRKVNLQVQQRKIGFVFQDYALFPNMTVEEHLRFGTADNEYLEELFQIGKLHDFRKHKPKQLSGGQQQRLSLLRALATKPRLLLMDEPFSALDAKTKTQMLPALKMLISRQKMTVLVVTHQPKELEDFAAYTFDLGSAEPL